MARRSKLKPLEWFMVVVGTLVGVGIGGAFVDGFFMDKIILSILPLIAHQIVGWAVIISVFLGIADILGIV